MEAAVAPRAEGEMADKRHQRHEQLTELARQAYEGHELVKRGVDRWLIKRPGSSIFWQEVAHLHGPRLVIVGDGPDLIFRMGDRGDPERAVHAAARDDLGYIRKKLLPPGSGQYWDEEVALDDLRQHVRELREAAAADEDGDVDAAALRQADAFAAALEEYSVGSGERAFYDVLTDHVPDAWEMGFGHVYDADLYYALAALKRLSALLTAAGAEPRTTAHTAEGG